MGKARRKYTDAYKAEVVELVINSGRPVAEIARELGINDGTLGNWMNMAKQRGEVTDKPLTIDDRARLKELEDENRRLRMEREILKKSRGVVCESEPVKFASRPEHGRRRTPQTTQRTNPDFVDL